MENILSRRSVLIGSAATIAAAALPAAALTIAEAPTTPEVLPAWAVGTPGEFDWQHVTGRTADEAIRNFMCEQVGGDGCDAEEGEDCDFECEWCSTIGGLEADRKPMWDGKRDVTSADWIRSGTGHICSRCSYETCRDEGGHGVGDEAVCSDCMTLADWNVVDPERAAEMREIK